MSNFTPLVKKEYEFEGDKVFVTFSRLRRKHMLESIPVIQQIQKASAEGVEPDVLTMSEFLGGLIDKLPEYVNEVKGLVDVNGDPVTIQTISQDFYFMTLATQLVMDLVKESSPTMADDSGNV